MAAKRRATYPKELRADAKAKQHGLLTISIEFANGTLLEEQRTINIDQAMFAKWAMALLFAEELQKFPDLETTIKELIQS